VGEGAYLFIPVLGPSNPRDLTGFGPRHRLRPPHLDRPGTVVDALVSTRTGVTVVDTRESLIEVIDAVNRESLDPYSHPAQRLSPAPHAEIRNTTDATTPAAAGPAGFGVGTGVQLPGPR
jgi:phospholipid-binding lipoprotein MlaA